MINGLSHTSMRPSKIKFLVFNKQNKKQKVISHFAVNNIVVITNSFLKLFPVNLLVTEKNCSSGG